MPTATDLVTDLPADFEVFGQAVATSMADLLGGTSGQILAKNSNTDMDFVWIANDQGDITGVTAGTGISGGGTSGTVTVTNSMATTIDAKGDLVPGTGADTFARLAVGANNTFLRANSATATGLEYAGTYTTFTPTYQNLTTGNGTNTGRYLRIGNFVHVTQKFVFGSTSSVGGNVSCDFPFTAVSTSGNLNMGAITYLDAGVKGYSGFANLNSTTVFALLVNDASTLYLGNASMNATTPHVWGSGDEFYVNYVFEAA